MTFGVEALGDHHDLGSFDCGVAELDEWLRLHARHATRHGTRTFLLAHDEIVAGYFSVAPHLLERDSLPSRIGRGSPRRVPAILLAKLALDRRYHGQGLGADLLMRALGTMLVAARTAGGKLAVVDAIDDRAADFYERHDFIRLPGEPRRLVQKFSVIAAALLQPWP